MFNPKNIETNLIEDLILKEQSTFSNELFFITKFSKLNSSFKTDFSKIVLNFSFKSIGFNRKKVITFFLLMELITNQKCCVTKSRKNVLVLKLRQGSVAGCKVTLRKKNLYNFLDTLTLALPRTDNFIGFNYEKLRKNKNSNAFSVILTDLFMFYPSETRLNSNVKKLDLTFVFNTKLFEEKIFALNSNFIPIKLFK